MLRFLKYALFGSSNEREDGFGQSLADDVRYRSRFRSLTKRELVWGQPTGDDAKAIMAHPLLRRFGDDVRGAATIDGRISYVLENDWHGWPDPPRYALFAFERDNDPFDGCDADWPKRIWAGASFDRWPGRWTLVLDQRSD